MRWEYHEGSFVTYMRWRWSRMSRISGISKKMCGNGVHLHENEWRWRGFLIENEWKIREIVKNEWWSWPIPRKWVEITWISMRNGWRFQHISVDKMGIMWILMEDWMKWREFLEKMSGDNVNFNERWMKGSIYFREQYGNYVNFHGRLQGIAWISARKWVEMVWISRKLKGNCTDPGKKVERYYEYFHENKGKWRISWIIDRFLWRAEKTTRVDCRKRRMSKVDKW